VLNKKRDIKKASTLQVEKAEFQAYCRN